MHKTKLHEKRENDCFSPHQPLNLKAIFVAYLFTENFSHPHKVSLKNVHFQAVLGISEIQQAYLPQSYTGKFNLKKKILYVTYPKIVTKL